MFPSIGYGRGPVAVRDFTNDYTSGLPTYDVFRQTLTAGLESLVKA